MRNLKRALSLAMASVMLLGMMVVGTGASYADVDSTKNVEAIEVMQAVGVMTGDDKGNFNPDQKVTRGEMAVVMANLLNLNVKDFIGAKTPFTDVPEWAVPYVAACYADGITAGISATQYGFNYEVTTAQAALMMMKALGYFQNAKDFGSDWQVATVKQGSKINLFDGITAGASTAMTRNEVAQIALNTLEATMVETDGTSTDITLPGDISISTGDTKYVDVTSKESYASAFSDSAVDNNGTYAVQLGEKLFDGDLTKISANDDLGRPGYTWDYKSDEIGTYADKADDMIVVNNDDAATISSVLTSSDYFNLKSSNIASTVSYTLNGDTKASGTALQAGDVVEIFKNDGKVTDVAVARYTLAKIDDVDTDVSDTDAKNDVTAYISLESLGGTAIGNGTYNDTDINGYVASTYKEEAFLAVALNGSNDVVDSYVANTAEGTVTAYKSSAVTIGGTKYNIVATPDANTVTSFDFDDTNYVAYLTKEGYVLAIDGTEAVKLDEVYYVYGTYYTKAANGNQTFYALVVDMEGVKSEIQIEATTYVNTFGKDAAADTFQQVDALYTFTDKDAKDSSGNNANGDAISGGSTVTTVADPKANNDKFSAVKYDTAAADGDFYVTDSTLSMTNGLSASSGTIVTASGTPTKAYLNDSTKYILIDKDGSTADMDIDVYTGGAKIANGKNVIVISTKSGSSYVAQVVIAADNGVSTGVVDTNAVVYLAKQPTTQVKDGYEATLYFMDGSNKTVTVDNNDTAGFYNFSVNSDGVYELTLITNEIYGADGSLSQNYTYDDQAGWVSGTIDSIFQSSKLSLTDKTVNVNKTVSVNDVNIVKETQVVDSRSTKNVYENEINTLAKLEAAMNRGSVQVKLYLDNGNVLLIAVTGMGLTNDSNSAAVQSMLDSTNSASVGSLSQAIIVTVKNGQTLTFSTAQTVNHTVTVKSGATLVVPNGTLIGSSGLFTSTSDVVMNSANGGVQVSANAGTITVNNSTTIDDNDKVTLTGSAVLVGKTADSTKLTIGDSSVKVATSNFYTSSKELIPAGTITDGTYTWKTDIKGDGSNVAGWLAD